MVPPHFYQKDEKVEKSDLVRKSHIFPIQKEHALTKDQATQIYEEIEKIETINVQIVSHKTENKKKIRQEQIKEEDIDMQSKIPIKRPLQI